jgi:hypothetical protein
MEVEASSPEIDIVLVQQHCGSLASPENHILSSTSLPFCGSHIREIHPYTRLEAYVRAKNPSTVQAANAKSTRRLISKASVISILAIARCFFRVYHPGKVFTVAF